MFRRRSGGLEVLLVRPGGPFWRKRQVGAWMIPKGGIEAGESAVDAALREFQEETGTKLEAAPFPLARIRQAGGKIVDAFAVEGDLDASAITSIDYEMEWPPRSGQRRRFPEIDEARWMTIAEARRMMLPSQLSLLDTLEAKLRP